MTLSIKPPVQLVATRPGQPGLTKPRPQAPPPRRPQVIFWTPRP